MSSTPPGYRRFRVKINSAQHLRPKTVEVDARSPEEAIERVAIECERLDQACQPRTVDRTFTIETGQQHHTAPPRS